MISTVANRGRALEQLVLASNGRGVELVKVPHGARFLPGGKVVHERTLVDFVGVLDNGRAIAFDAKMGRLKHRINLSEDHLPEHQRRLLIAWGQHGALAGLLAMDANTDRLYWIDWMKLQIRSPSMAWADLPWVGSAKMAIEWDAVVWVATKHLHSPTA